MSQKAMETLNNTLRDTLPGTAWKHSALIKELHEWTQFFSTEFRLGLPTPVIAITKLRRRRLGHFRLIRNGFGLQDEIAIDEDHALKSPRWRVLGTLLHEQLHQWQLVVHGRDVAKRWTRNYHDREFRDKAASLGLEIDIKGRTQYPDGDTSFRRLLVARGINLTEVGPATAKSRARTTLILWVCRCDPPVKIRVGRAKIRVRCQDCDCSFTPCMT